MGNRAMRRAAAKANHNLLKNMSRDAKKAALIRNGITVEDLEKNYHLGYDEGFSAAVRATGSLTYAAIGIALHDLYDFDDEAILRVVREVDKHVTMDFSSLDAAEELLEKTGIRINFDDPVERIEEVDNHEC